MNSTNVFHIDYVAVGAKATGRLIQDIAEAIAPAKQVGGKFDLDKVAALIDKHLNCQGPQRKGALLALADYLASAVDGCVPDAILWNPAEFIAA